MLPTNHIVIETDTNNLSPDVQEVFALLREISRRNDEKLNQETTLDFKKFLEENFL